MPVGIDMIASAKSEKKEKEEQNRIIQGIGVQFAKTVSGAINVWTFRN